MLMMLSSVLDSSLQPLRPLVVLQSSSAQSCLQLLREIGKEDSCHHATVMCCLVHPPSTFIAAGNDHTVVVDRTGFVPGYDDASHGHTHALLDAVRNGDPAPSGPLSVLVDSVDTLASDLGSATKTVALLGSVLQIVQERPAPSRLVLHINVSLLAEHADVLSLLLQTPFSSSLVHVIAHPPALLHHLATAYSTPPPPMTQPEKFWSVFTPFVERGPAFEAERLVFGSDGEGGSGFEFIIELLVRGESGRDGRRGSRGVERSLEGWGAGQPCSLQSLASLQPVFGRKVAHVQPASDPTQDVTFNLNLTAQQQHERSQVPLPYAHEGNPQMLAPGAILYEPDSADDIDEDDPDEDLDI